MIWHCLRKGAFALSALLALGALTAGYRGREGNGAARAFQLAGIRLSLHRAGEGLRTQHRDRVLHHRGSGAILRPSGFGPVGCRDQHHRVRPRGCRRGHAGQAARPHQSGLWLRPHHRPPGYQDARGPARQEGRRARRRALPDLHGDLAGAAGHRLGRGGDGEPDRGRRHGFHDQRPDCRRRTLGPVRRPGAGRAARRAGAQQLARGILAQGSADRRRNLRDRRDDPESPGGSSRTHGSALPRRGMVAEEQRPRATRSSPRPCSSAWRTWNPSLAA